jgi:signal transduction histidine kinase
VDCATLLELLPEGTLSFKAGAGWNDPPLGQAVADAAAATPAALVLSRQTPILVEDFRSDDRFPDASRLRSQGILSSVNVPLYGRERPFGVLAGHSLRSRRFSSDDVAFLQSVANILSAAMEADWSERRHRERYLRRAEQMMALGQVAAGVAHELRNPLTAIKGLIQLNLRRATASAVPAEDLAVIEHEIRRMERTLQTFLDFARPPKPDRRLLDLGETVERVFSLVSGRARKQNVGLILLRRDAPVLAEADQDQLQQLVLNLVLNALDAMPAGGTIEVELHPPRDGLVELYVRDTGPGVSPEVFPKVFETFVSSKETGVGLGLPVSKRIAEDHGGSLSTYNLPGAGACFVLRLPAPAAM